MAVICTYSMPPPAPCNLGANSCFGPAHVKLSGAALHMCSAAFDMRPFQGRGNHQLGWLE